MAMFRSVSIFSGIMISLFTGCSHSSPKTISEIKSGREVVVSLNEEGIKEGDRILFFWEHCHVHNKKSHCKDEPLGEGVVKSSLGERKFIVVKNSDFDLDSNDAAKKIQP
jgi:hypothetical protein